MYVVTIDIDGPTHHYFISISDIISFEKLFYINGNLLHISAGIVPAVINNVNTKNHIMFLFLIKSGIRLIISNGLLNSVTETVSS